MKKMNKVCVGTVERWSTAHFTDTPGESTNITFKNGTLRNNPWPFEPHEECYLVKKSDLDAYEARIEQLKHTSVWNENQLLKAKIKALEAEKANLRDINKSLGEANSKLAEQHEALNDAIRDIYCGMTSESELMKENEKLKAENVYLTRINADFFRERSKLVEENEALVERNTKLKVRLDKFYGMTSVGEELRAANEKLAAEVADLNKRISHLKVILEYDENRMAALITENNKLRGTNNELNAVIVQLRQKLDIIGLTGAYDS